MLDNTFKAREQPEHKHDNLSEFRDAVAVICKYCDYSFICDYNCPLDPIIKVVTGEDEENESEEF